MYTTVPPDSAALTKPCTRLVSMSRRQSRHDATVDPPSLPDLWRSALANLDLDNALIFADDRAATSLACAIGLRELLDLGVANILPLGRRPSRVPAPVNPAHAGRPLRHAVALCSTFLPEAYSALRVSLIQPGLQLSQVTVVCGLSDRAHATYAGVHEAAPASSASPHASPAGTTAAPTPPSLGGGAYAACREEVCRWLGGGEAQVEVRVVQLAVPAQLCPLGSTAFLLPVDGAEPLLHSDLPELQRAAVSRGDRSAPLSSLDQLHGQWSALPTARQRSLGACAMALVGWMDAAAIKPSLFALGPTALLVARQINAHVGTTALPQATSADGGGGGGAGAAATTPHSPSRPGQTSQLSASAGGGDTPPPAAATIAEAAGGAQATSPRQPPPPSAPPVARTPVEASVLIIDRSVDVVAPALRSDHPLDLLLAEAAGAARHAEDVAAGAVPTGHSAADAAASPVAPRRPPGPPSPPSPRSSPSSPVSPSPRPPPPPPPPPPPLPSAPLPVSVVQTLGGSECAPLLESLLSRRTKEVGKKLLEALAAAADAYEDELPLVDMPSRPTPRALRELLGAVRGVPRACWERAPELAAVEMLLEALDAGGGDTRLAVTCSHQKLLQHTASESVAMALTELIALSARGRDGGAVRELVLLVAMVYSLSGEAVANGALDEAETRLREALLQACLRDPAAGGLLAAGIPRVPVDQLPAPVLMERRHRLQSALGTLFERLRALAAARRAMPPSEALLLPSAQTAGEVYRPLLRHVLERALRQEDVGAVEPLSGSFGSLVGAFFGRRSQARLADHRTIVLFVIGGISLAELRELRQLAAQYPQHRVWLGATRIATPDTVFELLTAGVRVQ